MGCAHSKTNKKSQKKTNEKPVAKILQETSASSDEDTQDVTKKCNDAISGSGTATMNDNQKQDVKNEEAHPKHEVIFHEEQQVPAKAVESFYVTDIPNIPDIPCLPPLDETQKKEREEIKQKEKNKRKNEERKRKHQVREAKVPLPVMNWDNAADTEYFKMKCKQRLERRDRATKELKPDDDTLYEIPTRMPEMDYTREQPVA